MSCSSFGGAGTVDLVRLDGFDNAADTVLDPKSCIQASTGFKLKREQVNPNTSASLLTPSSS